MPKAEHYTPAAIRAALDQQEITPALLDETVRRQLRAIAALQLDDDTTLRPEAIDTLEHRALNREVARSGFVLLKNDRRSCRSSAASCGGSRWSARAAIWSTAAGAAPTSPPPARRRWWMPCASRSASRCASTTPPARPRRTPSSQSRPPSCGRRRATWARACSASTSSAGSAPARPSWSASTAPSTSAGSWPRRPPGCPRTTSPCAGPASSCRRSRGSTCSPYAPTTARACYLDGKLVIDNWGDHAPTLKTTEIELVAGKAYDLRLEYYEGIIGASVELLWQRADKDPLRRVSRDRARSRHRARGRGQWHVRRAGGRGPDLAGPARPAERHRARGRGRQSQGRGHHHRRGRGGHAVARPGRRRAARLVPRPGGGQGHGGRPARRHEPLGQAAGDLPQATGGRARGSATSPARAARSTYQEGLLVGYRGYDTRGVAPLFPFGYGLSYTTFAYRDLGVTPWHHERGVTARLKVKNTGSRRGAEVVQLYVHGPDTRHRPAGAGAARLRQGHARPGRGARSRPPARRRAPSPSTTSAVPSRTPGGSSPAHTKSAPAAPRATSACARRSTYRSGGHERPALGGSGGRKHYAQAR